MNVKFQKANTLAEGLITRISSMLDEIDQKPCTTIKNVIDRGKRSKALSEVKLVENISKNLQSFLERSPVQKEIFLSNNLQDHGYE